MNEEAPNRFGERLGPSPDALNTFQLTTTRLELVAGGLVDAHQMFNLLQGPDRQAVTATLRWGGPDSVDGIIEFVENMSSAPYSEFGFQWVIRDATGEFTGDAGIAIGSIGTRPLESGRGDVGYWLGRPYWGNGIMTEALSAVRDLAFAEMNLAKLEAEVFTDNVAGNRLVTTVGMTLEGTTRRYMFKRGRWIDANRYGILFEEWQALAR